jgi:hypothetical protein
MSGREEMFTMWFLGAIRNTVTFAVLLDGIISSVLVIYVSAVLTPVVRNAYTDLATTFNLTCVSLRAGKGVSRVFF